MDSPLSPHNAEDAGLLQYFDLEWPLLHHDPTNEDLGPCDFDLPLMESICNLESIQQNVERIGIALEAGEGKFRPIIWFNLQFDISYSSKLRSGLAQLRHYPQRSHRRDDGALWDI